MYIYIFFLSLQVWLCHLLWQHDKHCCDKSITLYDTVCLFPPAGSGPQTKEELGRLIIPMSVTAVILVVMLGLVTLYYCKKHSGAICSCTCCRQWLMEHKRLSSMGSDTADSRMRAMRVLQGGCPCSADATNTTHVCCENCMSRKAATSRQSHVDNGSAKQEVLYLSPTSLTGELGLETIAQSGAGAGEPCEKCQHLGTVAQRGVVLSDVRVLCERCQQLETNVQFGRQQETCGDS